jgi:hypothetical protein
MYFADVRYYPFWARPRVFAPAWEARLLADVFVLRVEIWRPYVCSALRSACRDV